MPPWNELWDLFRYLLVPAAGISLAVMLAIRLFGGEKWGALASALSVLGGVLAANHWREAMPIRLQEDRPLSCGDLIRVLGWSLERKPIVSTDDFASLENFGSLPEDVPQVSPRYWLPWLAILAIGIELLAGWPRFSPGTISAAKAFVSLMAGRLLTPTYFRVDYPWSSWALGFVIFAEWNVVTILAQVAGWHDPGGIGIVLCRSCGDSDACTFSSLHGHGLVLFRRPGWAGSDRSDLAERHEPRAGRSNRVSTRLDVRDAAGDF